MRLQRRLLQLLVTKSHPSEHSIDAFRSLSFSLTHHVCHNILSSLVAKVNPSSFSLPPLLCSRDSARPLFFRCYDEAIAVSGQKLSYSIDLDLSFNSDARPVFAAMSARKTCGTGEADPLPSGPGSRQLQLQQQQQQQQQEHNTPRATVAGIPVENFDRMHRGAVHRPEVGTAERPSCSNLQPWLQTPRSWGLRYEVDLQHDIGAMINYVPGNDVASLRGHTMIPRGTDASWHIKLSRLGKKYTTRVGVVNTNLRVRDDWYRARSPPGAWFINTSGDMYEDINKRGNTVLSNPCSPHSTPKAVLHPHRIPSSSSILPHDFLNQTLRSGLQCVPHSSRLCLVANARCRAPALRCQARLSESSTWGAKA